MASILKKKAFFISAIDQNSNAKQVQNRKCTKTPACVLFSVFTINAHKKVEMNGHLLLSARWHRENWSIILE